MILFGNKSNLLFIRRLTPCQLRINIFYLRLINVYIVHSYKFWNVTSAYTKPTMSLSLHLIPLCMRFLPHTKQLQFYYKDQQVNAVEENNCWNSKNHKKPLNTRWGKIRSLSRDSAVGTAAGHGLDDQEVGVRVPVGQEFSLLHVVHTGSGAHPASYPMGIGDYFSGGKAAGAWSRPLTSSLCRGQENVDIYIHSPIRLHA
jgi:hypothetical protein